MGYLLFYRVHAAVSHVSLTQFLARLEMKFPDGAYEEYHGTDFN